MTGCLCIHGFTGAPYEVEPLVQYLKEKTNWNFRVPTLPGHGESLDLKGIKYKEWMEHAEEELKELLKTESTVYVIGFSMGGLIASYLSVKYPVKKLVLLSAAVYYVNPRQFLSDVKMMISDSFRGTIKENELFGRYRKKLTSTPISATIEFRKLVKYVRPLLKKIKIPTLIVQGESDGIVPVKSAHYINETIPSSHKELMFLPSSKHLVCHSEEANHLFVKVERFLSEGTGQ